ncbi:GspH/FimT family pseudopilin [Paraglaciecola sp.]|uniref:GspH/FimT family pseudopilin n=1 Tax=Paraglaciecola sp. TaxID=1920173 RepID=UPI0030F44DA3
MRKQKGLSLIEMLVSLAIVGIIITAVSPSIQGILIKNKIVSEINELSAVIQFARNNAIDQQITTVVCPSDDYLACTTNWNNPKIVFIDSDNDGNRGAAEELLATTGAISDNNVLTGPNSSLSFNPSGEARAISNLLLCHNSKNAEYARSMTIAFQGRVKVSGDSDRNGIHEDADGVALSCP